ncbi:MAG: ribosomal RNA small subunit methyltransferase A [Opitutales bacterium]|nr:ribosomal RNA small subunit methyltransferase A [Opitutales bacterium]
MNAPLTPSQTRSRLNELGHHPRKKLGQNFLIDGNIVRKSLELAGVQSGDTVIEVGPGLGTLTAALVVAGAEVYAVELDRTLTEGLRQQFGERIHLLEGDAVDHPLAGYMAESPQVTAAPCKVVANLPYAVTSPWMEAMLRGPLPECMVLMMQKEAADRLNADVGSKHFSAITIFLDGTYRSCERHRVARQCFYPVPGVDSVLAVWRRREQVVRYSAGLREAIRHIFTMRRKQMQALVKQQPLLEPWFQAEVEAGLSATARPEEVPLSSWRKLGQ